MGAWCSLLSYCRGGGSGRAWSRRSQRGGQLRFQAGSRSAAAPRVQGLGIARSLRFHAGRRTPGQRKPAASREPDWATILMSHYVVTGGAGFIGSAIVRKLLEEGARRVLAIDNLLT